MFISCQLYKSSFIDFIGGRPAQKGGDIPPYLAAVFFTRTDRRSMNEYRRILPKDLVEGQSYFIVPTARLITTGLAKKGFAGDYTFPDSIPETKKNTILFPEGRLASLSKDAHDRVTAKFTGLQSKGKALKKSEETHVFSYARDADVVIYSTSPVAMNMGTKRVGAEAAKAVLGHLDRESEEYALATATTVTTANATTSATAPAVTVVTNTESIHPKMLDNTKKLWDALLDGRIRNEPLEPHVKSLFKSAHPPNIHQTKLVKLSGGDVVALSGDEYRYRDITNDIYVTPLAYAIVSRARGSTLQEDVEYLLSQGADPSHGLIGALLVLNAPIVKLLLDKGANPNTLSVEEVGGKEVPLHPLLVTMPGDQVNIERDTWLASARAAIAGLLLETRVFKEVAGRLERADIATLNRSVPHDLVEIEMVVTHTLLEEVRARVASIQRLMASLPAERQSQAYLYLMETMVGFAQKAYDRQQVTFAEPGGPAYQAARNRVLGRELTNAEARDRAANAAVNAMMRKNTPAALGREARKGGARKTRRGSKNRRQSRKCRL